MKNTDTIIPQKHIPENNKYIPSGFIYLNPVSENKLKNMFAVHLHTVAKAIPFGGNISALYKYITVPIEVPKKNTYVTVNMTNPKFHPVSEIVPDAIRLANIPMHPYINIVRLPNRASIADHTKDVRNMQIPINEVPTFAINSAS